jgi:WD40 repeat protein
MVADTREMRYKGDRPETNARTDAEQNGRSTMPTATLPLIASLVLSASAPVLRDADDKPVDPDEALLQEATVGTDAAALLENVHKNTGTDDDLLNLDKLINQLASTGQKAREEASARLVKPNSHRPTFLLSPRLLSFSVQSTLLHALNPRIECGDEKPKPIVLEGHTDRVRCVAFSPDGTSIATGGDDGSIRVWDPKTGEQRVVLDDPKSRTFWLAFSPDGQLLLASFTWGKGKDAVGGVRAWQWKDKKIAYTIELPPGAPVLASIPDGKLIATTRGAFDAFDLLVSDVLTGKQKSVLTDREEAAKALAISPSEKLLAVGTDNGRIELWDLPTAKRLATVRAFARGSRINELCFSPDGKTLAATSDLDVDASLKLFDVDQDAITLRHATNIQCNGQRCLRYVPDGTELLCARGLTVVFLAPWSAKRLRAIACCTRGEVEGIATSPDGKYLATANGQDCKATVTPLADPD